MMVTDFHSHILPGIDDGSASVEESIAMLRLEREQGITRVVATPHFYPRHDDPERFLERRSRGEALLREAMSREQDLPELLVGAEVHFFSGMSDSDILPRLTIQGTKALLVEMPAPPWTASMYRELEQIWLRWGITPIIAHVDRYIRPLRTYGIPKKLAEMPVMVQANASFFHREMAIEMLKKGQIQLLGSDCHNLTSRRPNLGDAVEKIRRRLGEQTLEQIRAAEERLLRD